MRTIDGNRAAVFCRQARKTSPNSFDIRQGFKDIARDFGYDGVVFVEDAPECYESQAMPLPVLYDEDGQLEDAAIAPGDIAIFGSMVMYKGPVASEMMERYLIQREAPRLMERISEVIKASGCGDYDADALGTGTLEGDMRSLVKVISFYREYGQCVDALLSGLNGDFLMTERFPSYEMRSAAAYPRDAEKGGFPTRIMDLCKIWQAALDKKDSLGYIPLEGSNLEHIGKMLGINLMVSAYYEGADVSTIVESIH